LAAFAQWGKSVSDLERTLWGTAGFNEKIRAFAACCKVVFANESRMGADQHVDHVPAHVVLITFASGSPHTEGIALEILAL
jgi:hypothetical protein